jgi:predicted anti-sigma-YlaC factor YlaD
MSQRADLGNCSNVLERLEAWVDGELDASEAAGLEMHIAQCTSCRTAKSEAEELVTGLRSLPEFEVPAHVLQSVPGFARPPVWARFGRSLTTSARRPAPAVAAIALVVLAIILVAPWRNPPTPKYTDHEIERATHEVRLAFAYVGSAVQRAELSVKRRVLDDGAVIRTVHGLGQTMKVMGGAATATAELPATPLPK